MTYQGRRYIFRFIHVQSASGWSVRDTLSGRVFGSFASEDEAVAAALFETHRHSEFRRDDRGGAIPLV